MLKSSRHVSINGIEINIEQKSDWHHPSHISDATLGHPSDEGRREDPLICIAGIRDVMSVPLTSVRYSPCWHYCDHILRREIYQLTDIAKQMIGTSLLGDIRKIADISNQMSAMTWLTESSITLLTCPTYLFGDIFLWHHLTDTLCRDITVNPDSGKKSFWTNLILYFTVHLQCCNFFKKSQNGKTPCFTRGGLEGREANLLLGAE